MKTIWNKKKNMLVNFLENNSIKTISGIPILIASLVLIGWVILKQSGFVADGKTLDAIILFAAIFLIGFTGVLYIYKKEMPGVISSQTIKGWWAVFSGILLITFFWGVAIISLILSIMEQ